MKRTLRIYGLLSLLVLATTSISAFAASQSTLQIIDDLGNKITISESGVVITGGACTATTCATDGGGMTTGTGVIMWSGTIGRFHVGPTVGKFEPVGAYTYNSADLQLNAVNNSGVDGSLHVYFSTTGVEGGGPSFSMNTFDLVTGGTVGHTYTANFDNTNAVFGAGLSKSLALSCAPGSNCFLAPMYATGGPASNPFSMTNEMLVTIPSSASVNVDYQLRQTPGPLSLSCAGTTAGTVGVVYSDSLVAAGGVPPYGSYILTAGSLPAGLTLNSTNGLISGSPSASGPFNFTAKVSDAAGASATTITPNCTVNIAPPSATGGGGTTGPYTTYTQGGWGAVPHGNNPGYVLTKNFSAVYPSGVAVGGMYKLTFTSAAAVINFLPMGTTAGRLTSNATNPTKSIGGVLAGQVLALQLSVDFSNRGITRPGLALLHIATGKAATATVGDALACANAVLGGGPLPYGFSLSDIVSILDSINNNFDNGTTNHGYLY